MSLYQRVNILEEKYHLTEVDAVVHFTLNDKTYKVIDFKDVVNWNAIPHYTEARNKFFESINLIAKMVSLKDENEDTFTNGILDILILMGMDIVQKILDNMLEEHDLNAKTILIEGRVATIIDILSIIDVGMLYGFINTHERYDNNPQDVIDIINKHWDESDEDKIINGIKSMITSIVNNLKVDGENFKLATMEPINSEAI